MLDAKVQTMFMQCRFKMNQVLPPLCGKNVFCVVFSMSAYCSNEKAFKCLLHVLVLDVSGWTLVISLSFLSNLFCLMYGFPFKPYLTTWVRF